VKGAGIVATKNARNTKRRRMVRWLEMVTEDLLRILARSRKSRR